MSKTENYTITFVGATPNQAQAINGVLASIQQLKSRDELPIKKYENELEPMYKDLALFRQLLPLISTNADLQTKVVGRISHYEEEIKTRETAIKNHKENIEFIDNYLKEVRSHIREEVDTAQKTVVYTYDTAYFKPFLDLAGIVFEMSFEDPKKTATGKAS